MELMDKTNKSASDLLEECPEFTVRNDKFYTESQKKLGVLSVIGKPSGDGVYVKYGDGGVRIISNKRGYALTSEAADGEYAEWFDLFTSSLISEMLKQEMDKVMGDILVNEENLAKAKSITEIGTNFDY